MAEVDTRVEALEDEIKVLKGEVRRTLVDLRALLMREDSPLNDRTFGRPAPLQDTETGGEPTITRKEVSEMVRQETAEAARPPAPDTNPQSPPASTNPGQPVSQGAGMAIPGSAFPGMPMAQNPMWGVGGGYPSPPPQAPPSAPQPPDPAIAERERKMAEQERRMEEQERRLADQEHRLTSAARSESAPQPPDPAIAERERKLAEQERRMEEQGRQLADQERRLTSAARSGDAPQPPDPAITERERKLAEQERRMEEQGRQLADQERRPTSAARSEDARERDADRRVPQEEPAQDSPEAAAPRAELEKRRDKEESHRDYDQEEHTPPSQVRSSEYRGSDQVTTPHRPGSSSDREKQDSFDEAGDSNSEPPEVPQDVWYGDKITLEYDTHRVVQRPPENSGSPSKPERPLVNNGEDEEEHAKAITSNGRGNRVYDEYNELLAETKEFDGAVDGDLRAIPLDVNLLSSLTHWTSVARNRVGEQRLMGILDLYSQSGHLSASLRELLAEISGLVDGAHPQTSEDVEEFMDLIFHLHGILAGGLAIGQIQQAKPAN